MQDNPKSVSIILTTQKFFTGNLTPAKIAIIYALVGGLWILFSDKLLTLFASDPQILTRLQTAKGWFYVVVTAWMLYALIDRAIAERKHAEAALRESEERYRTLFDGVPIGLYRTTPEGKILDVNTTVVEMFGYPNRETLLAANAKDVYLASDLRQQWLDLLVTGEVVRAEKQERRFDGSLIWVRDTARAVLDNQGQVLYYEGALEDITERKRLEDQLRQSQKMEAVGRLTAGIAHDFNNLLTAINGFAELMKLEMARDDPQQESLDKILNSGRRAADLVRQLLAFSRRQVIEPKALNLNTSVVKMDKMLRRVIGENIELHTNLAPDLWLVKADSSQIEQLIINLAVNARDAMPNGGRLTLETANVVLDEEYVAHHLDSKPGEHVMLAVSDTGHGISEEIRPYIFEPFFTTKKQGKGTGLGLSTVYGIVKQNGGNIWVYSEEGQGTTIKIYLPRSRTTADLPVVHGESGVEMPFGIETILLVEDDLHVRELARLVLQGRGYTLLEAENGQEALDLAARYAGSIHLLLTDVVMPGMSGKELADTLVQTHPNLKILYMSGYTDNAIVHHGVLDADVDLLQKPFSPMALARKVRVVLDS